MSEACFYCDRPLRRVEQRKQWFRDSPADRYTKDHIIPQVALRAFGKRVPETFHRLNVVACCHYCNNAKGDMDPVYWARTLGPAAVQRLAERFMEMGVSAEYVALLPNGHAVLRSVTEAA